MSIQTHIEMGSPAWDASKEAAQALSDMKRHLVNEGANNETIMMWYVNVIQESLE